MQLSLGGQNRVYLLPVFHYFFLSICCFKISSEQYMNHSLIVSNCSYYFNNHVGDNYYLFVAVLNDSGLCTNSPADKHKLAVLSPSLVIISCGRFLLFLFSPVEST
mgnify:CR=1 FL=1